MSFLDRLLRRTRIQPPFAKHLRLPHWPDALYAVGDVHGCYEALLELERSIQADAAQFPGPKLIVMLGDYVDRGPRSAEVISHLLAAPPAGFTRVTLAGNHEQMLLAALQGSGPQDWLQLEGAETLRSYGIDAAAFTTATRRAQRDMLTSHIPPDHVTFLQELAISLAVENTVFVHAGLRRNIPLEQQDVHDLLWIRQDFLDADPTDGLLVVHGHTPAPEVQLVPGRIGVDTGAFATGRLSAVRMRSGAEPVIFTTQQ